MDGRRSPRQLPHANQPHLAALAISIPARVDPTASLLAAQTPIANALGQSLVPVPEAVPQAGPTPYAAPRGNAPDSLQMRLPAVDPALFRAILENRLNRRTS